MIRFAYRARSTNRRVLATPPSVRSANINNKNPNATITPNYYFANVVCRRTARVSAVAAGTPVRVRVVYYYLGVSSRAIPKPVRQIRRPSRARVEVYSYRVTNGKNKKKNPLTSPRVRRTTAVHATTRVRSAIAL